MEVSVSVSSSSPYTQHYVDDTSYGYPFSEDLYSVEEKLQRLQSQLEAVVDGKQLEDGLLRLLDKDRLYMHLYAWEQLSLLEQFVGLSCHVQLKLLRLLNGLESADLRTPLGAVHRCSLPDSKRLLTLLEGLKVWERQKLLTVLKGVEVSEQETLLTLLEKLKAWKQWKLLELLEDLAELGKVKLLGLLEEMEAVKLLKLLERMGPQERKKFYRLLVLLEPWMLKMLLQLKLTRLERMGSQVEGLKLPGLKLPGLWLRGIQLQGSLESYKLLLQLLIESLSVYLSEDGDDRRGGFRNLLLDGWWLEFWEIILLVAGDVERNPGPRRMTDEQLKNICSTSLGTDDLSAVFDAVYNCRAKWHNLCLILGISADDLSAIKKEQSDDSDDCLREGLTRWLKKDYDTEEHGPPTWRRLVDAVANSSGGDDHALALDIADKHNATPNVPPKTNSCTDHQRSDEVILAFNSMYRSVRQLLQVNVCEVKDTLCCLIDPRCPDLDKLCIPREVYEDATSTNELLKRLCPVYINPKNTFVLRAIVENHGSQKCKRLLRKYLDRYLC